MVIVIINLKENRIINEIKFSGTSSTINHLGADANCLWPALRVPGLAERLAELVGRQFQDQASVLKILACGQHLAHSLERNRDLREALEGR